MGWSHFKELLPLKDPFAREFYAEMCRVERWCVRTLRQKIDGMLFERTALSKNSEELIRKELAALRDDGRMTPELVFRDPYLLDFLGLSGAYSEKDLESAILREMERFLLELGSGFSFVARQKRMSVGHTGQGRQAADDASHLFVPGNKSTSGPARYSSICKRDRTTGPCFPLVVPRCRTHNCAFTLYPPSHVPYGWQPP